MCEMSFRRQQIRRQQYLPPSAGLDEQWHRLRCTHGGWHCDIPLWVSTFMKRLPSTSTFKHLVQESYRKFSAIVLSPRLVSRLSSSKRNPWIPLAPVQNLGLFSIGAKKHASMHCPAWILGWNVERSQANAWQRRSDIHHVVYANYAACFKSTMWAPSADRPACLCKISHEGRIAE